MANLQSASDAVAAARRGQPEGWEWLFDHYYALVHKYLFASVGRSAADVVDDVAQEVFVAAVASINRLRGSDDVSIEGWLLGIARNKAADHHRRTARQQRSFKALREQAQPNAAPARPEEQGLDTATLVAALDALSEDQRDVLVRRFVLDQSLEHVAGTTGRSLTTVKSLQHRGLAALRRVLQREDIWNG